MKTQIQLYDTDYCVLNENNEPLRYSDNKIGLWSEEAVTNGEIELLENERFIQSTKLTEPYKSELLKQIGNATNGYCKNSSHLKHKF